MVLTGIRITFGAALVAVATACAPQATAPAGGNGATTAQASVECVPIEEGALYQVVNGRLAAAQAPDPVIIERVVEPELTWTERVEGTFPDLGFPWLQLNARNAEEGVITLTGLAPTRDVADRAYSAAERAIKDVPQGRDILIVDGISVEGEEEAVGAALEGLTAASSVGECQAAFVRVMEGRNVSFAVGRSDINEESARLLDAAAGVATLCSRFEIEVGGHTDKRGDAVLNQNISVQRARAVRQYLINKGVSSTILTARGYGETFPLINAETPEANAANRRTEFTVRDR
ncbi:MAG: OmpA family protein [Pseudomonadota bacterium]